jgi:hypothetical protein
MRCQWLFFLNLDLEWEEPVAVAATDSKEVEDGVGMGLDELQTIFSAGGICMLSVLNVLDGVVDTGAIQLRLLRFPLLGPFAKDWVVRIRSLPARQPSCARWNR